MLETISKELEKAAIRIAGLNCRRPCGSFLYDSFWLGLRGNQGGYNLSNSGRLEIRNALLNLCGAADPVLVDCSFECDIVGDRT